jgi:hypothetical protein
MLIESGHPTLADCRFQVSTPSCFLLLLLIDIVVVVSRQLRAMLAAGSPLIDDDDDVLETYFRLLTTRTIISIWLAPEFVIIVRSDKCWRLVVVADLSAVLAGFQLRLATNSHEPL